MIYKVVSLFILIWFYSVYLGKMFSQKKKGIQTNQINKGKKERSVLRVEGIMKVATYSILIVQIASIIMDWGYLKSSPRFTGFLLAVIGNVFFTVAVVTMKDSWRAGIPAEDKTSFVKTGIYAYSRNPAFTGFDFMYIGLLLMYCNPIMAVFTVWAVVMLHLQILQEEKFLVEVFKEEYCQYKSHVFRYFGRR